MAQEREVAGKKRRTEAKQGTMLGSDSLDDSVGGFSSEASFLHSPSQRRTGHARAYDPGNKMQNVRVNKDKLEAILTSTKSMQNYEDALWGFEKELNGEIRRNRLQLVDEMQTIQKNHENSTVQKETHKSLHALNESIKHRQAKVHVLRTRIEEIE